MMGYFLLAILIYFIYRFVAGFVIPVARTTSQVRQQFNTMKEQMQQAQQQYEGQQSQASAQQVHEPKPGAKGKYDIEGEYISFEEVK